LCVLLGDFTIHVTSHQGVGERISQNSKADKPRATSRAWHPARSARIDDTTPCDTFACGIRRSKCPCSPCPSIHMCSGRGLVAVTSRAARPAKFSPASRAFRSFLRHCTTGREWVARLPLRLSRNAFLPKVACAPPRVPRPHVRPFHEPECQLSKLPTRSCARRASPTQPCRPPLT